MPALVSPIAESRKPRARSRWPPLLGVARTSSARAACMEPSAACMLGWAAMATQAPTIAPAVPPTSRRATGDLGKKRAIEAILQTLNRRKSRPFASLEPATRRRYRYLSSASMKPEPAHRRRASVAGVGHAGLGLVDCLVDEVDCTLAMAALVGR